MTASIRSCSLFCSVSTVYFRVPTPLSNFLIDNGVLNPTHKLKHHLRLHVPSSALFHFFRENGFQNFEYYALKYPIPISLIFAPQTKVASSNPAVSAS